jgi:hypothetical protein
LISISILDVLAADFVIIITEKKSMEKHKLRPSMDLKMGQKRKIFIKKQP